MNRVTKWLSRFAAFTKTAWTFAEFTNLDNVAPLIDGANYASGYTRNPWTHACVHAIQADVAVLPIVLQDPAGEKVEKHPALDLLAYVNEGTDGAGHMAGTSGWLDLNGNAYWMLTEGQTPTAMWLLAADKVTLGKKAQWWEYRPNGDNSKVKEIPLEQMIQFKLWNPESDLYGLSPIQAAENSINLDHNIRALNGAFTKRGAIPSAMLQAEHPVYDDQMKQLRAQWDSVYGGTTNAGKMMILGGGMKYTQISLSGKDALFFELAKMSREEILAIFGVPPVRVGLLEYASYANASQQMRAYYENTVLPRHDIICNTLNEFYLPRFGLRGYSLKADTSDVAALQEDDLQKAQRLTLATGGTPWLTVDEARKEDRGLDPLPDKVGDVVYGDPSKRPLGEKPEPKPVPLIVPRPSLQGQGDEDTEDAGADMPLDEDAMPGAGRNGMPPKVPAATRGARVSLVR